MQHFHPLQGDGRDRGYVRPLGAIVHAAPQKGDDGRPMAALAIDQHQSGVWRQAPQVGGANEGRGIANGLLIDIVGRDQPGQLIHDIRRPLVEKIVAADDAHRHRQILRRAVLASGAQHHDLFQPGSVRILG